MKANLIKLIFSVAGGNTKIRTLSADTGLPYSTANHYLSKSVFCSVPLKSGTLTLSDEGQAVLGKYAIVRNPQGEIVEWGRVERVHDKPE